MSETRLTRNVFLYAHQWKLIEESAKRRELSKQAVLIQAVSAYLDEDLEDQERHPPFPPIVPFPPVVHGTKKAPAKRLR